MPDPYVPLPDDDESIDVLTADWDDYVRTAVPGWEPSDAALEVALRGAFADEVSTLYSLLRERADDEWNDFGDDILGLPAGEAAPATGTTTWVAKDTAGYTIDAGETIVIDAPTGRFAFEVVNATTIAPGGTTAAGVLIQALDTGTQTNALTGPILFDAQPAWVSTVTLDAPTSGASDPEDPDTYRDRIRRAAQLFSRSPILPRDFEIVAQEIAVVARALVRDGYDDNDSTSGNDRTVSVYPVDADGLAIGSGPKALVQALIESRREVNWIVRVADPTYTTVNVDITVSSEDGQDPTELEAAVTAALSDGPLNPALWGQPPLGELETWRYRTVLRRYEIAAHADSVEGVYDVVDVKLAASPGSPAAADLTLTGAAPLPLPGTINVTVVDPT